MDMVNGVIYEESISGWIILLRRAIECTIDLSVNNKIFVTKLLIKNGDLVVVQHLERILIDKNMLDIILGAVRYVQSYLTVIKHSSTLITYYFSLENREDANDFANYLLDMGKTHSNLVTQMSKLLSKLAIWKDEIWLKIIQKQFDVISN